MNTLSQLIKRKRKEKGMSQTGLAKRLGHTTGQLVSNVERGLCSWPEASLKELMMLLDVGVIEVKKAMLRDYRMHLDNLLDQV